jgi:hypothetical protein
MVAGGYAALSDARWMELLVWDLTLFGERAFVIGNWVSILLLWLLAMAFSTPLSVLRKSIGHSLFASFQQPVTQSEDAQHERRGDETAAICQLIKAGSRILNETAKNDYSTKSGMHARDLVEIEERYIWLLLGYLLLYLAGVTVAGLVLTNLGYEYQLWARSAPARDPFIAWSTAAYVLLLSYLLIVAAQLLVALGIPLSRREARLLQQERDKAAQERLEKQRSAAEAADDHILYLRAFAVDNRLSIAGVDLETLIAASLTGAGGVVALGNEPADTAGAGRVSVADEDWQATVLRLAAGAAQVFLIPATSPGTLWEIEMLQQHGWLSKTVFIMPPAAVTGPLDVTDLWADVQKRLPLELPPYHGNGAIIRLHDDGTIRDWNALGIDLASWDLKIPDGAPADAPWTPLCSEEEQSGEIDDDSQVDEPMFGAGGSGGDGGGDSGGA